MQIAAFFFALLLVACTSHPGTASKATSSSGAQMVVDSIVFDTSKTRIDPVELAAGGPPVDGIHSIDHPQFDSAAQTTFAPDTEVLGIVIDDEAKAYPLPILNWHEIVNDTIGGTPVSVTYCPLCDTPVVFARTVSGKETTFGVSGKLFQNCLVPYDRLSKTLWSQPWGLGIIGEHTNDVLRRFPVTRTDLASWIRKYPNSVVLSQNTGFKADYTKYPYGDYRTSDRGFTPIRNGNKIVGDPKARETIYAEADSQHPFDKFSGFVLRVRDDDVKSRLKYVETIQGRTFLIQWNRALKTVQFYENEQLLPTMTAFAFVYPALFQ